MSLRRPVALNVYLDAATLAQLNDLPGEIAGYGAITADTARALAASADTIRAILIRPAWENSTAAASAGAKPETGCGRRNHIGHGSSNPDPGSHAEGIDRRSLNPDTPCAGAGLLLDTGSGIDSRPDLGRSDPAGPNTNEQTHRACGTILDAGRAVYRPPDGTTDYVTARDRTCQFPGCRAPAARCDLDHRIPFDAGGVTCPHNLDALCRSHHRLKTFTTWTATRDAATDRLTWTSPLGRSHATEPSHLLHDALLVEAPPAVDDPPPF